MSTDLTLQTIQGICPNQQEWTSDLGLSTTGKTWPTGCLTTLTDQEVSFSTGFMSFPFSLAAVWQYFARKIAGTEWRHQAI
jgi:hypothetical protein